MKAKLFIWISKNHNAKFSFHEDDSISEWKCKSFIYILIHTILMCAGTYKCMFLMCACLTEWISSSHYLCANVCPEVVLDSEGVEFIFKQGVRSGYK